MTECRTAYDATRGMVGQLPELHRWFAYAKERGWVEGWTFENFERFLKTGRPDEPVKPHYTYQYRRLDRSRSMKYIRRPHHEKKVRTEEDEVRVAWRLEIRLEKDKAAKKRHSRSWRRYSDRPARSSVRRDIRLEPERLRFRTPTRHGSF